jgi:hypothetical protein
MSKWIPIRLAEAGYTVIHTLFSGSFEDVSGAHMREIPTVCTFKCPNYKMDLLQVGDAYITAHHHLQTNSGWMTARQAAARGFGTLWVDYDCAIVYGLSLQYCGNILVNATAQLQLAPTLLVAATMGCCLEPPTETQITGSLTYPHHNMAKLGKINGMDKGLRHFEPYELSTTSNGELYLSDWRNAISSPQRGRMGDALPTAEATYGFSMYGTKSQQLAHPDSLRGPNPAPWA